MRLLILSDSHGNRVFLEKILHKENDADLIFHLGDGAPDLLAFPEQTRGKTLFLTKGNCDSSAHQLAEEHLQTISGTVVYACHGHTRAVKSGLTTLLFTAMEKEANVCLYGHTHIPAIDFKNGILFLNPGAVLNGRYATVTLKAGGAPYPSLHTLN